MRPRNLGRVSVVVLVLSAGPTRADELIMRNGAVLTGVVLQEGDRVVLVTDSGGKRVFRRREVRSVKKGKPVQQVFQERLAALKPGDTAGRRRLAKWAAAVGLKDAAASLGAGEAPPGDRKAAGLEPKPDLSGSRSSARPDSAEELLGKLRDELKSGSLSTDVVLERRGGNVVVRNGKIAVLFRRNAPSIELYYILGRAARKAAEITPLGDRGDRGARLRSASLKRGDLAMAALTAEFTTARGRSLSAECVIRRGQETVELRHGKGTAAFRLQARSRFAVVPDMLADDLVFEAKRTGSRQVFPPDEHVLLHMIDDGHAVVVCDWLARNRDIAIGLEGAGDKRAFEWTEISGESDEKLWVSVIAREGIWHQEDCADFTISEYTKLEWRVPFPAKWRIELTRTDIKGMDGVTDSWESENGPTGTWLSGLGHTSCPLYVENGGAFLRIPKCQGDHIFSRIRRRAYRGSILMFPMRRAVGRKGGTTPEDAATVFDILEKTLGDGYRNVLGIAGAGIFTGQRLCGGPYPEGFVFAPTCGITPDIEKNVFGTNQEKEKRGYVVRGLDDMNRFVGWNRRRIDEYVAWADEMRRFYDSQNKAHPDLAEVIGDVEATTGQIGRDFARVEGTMKTPEHCRALSDKIIALIDSGAEDKVDQCAKLGRAIRVIGGAQDSLLAMCRMTAKLLRHQAGLIHSVAARTATREFSQEVRKRTQGILRIRSPYEGK